MKKEDFFDRLEHAFNVSGTSQLANLLGVVPTTVSNWKSGRNQPDYERLFTLCERKRINIHWLIMGEGEMFTSDLKNNPRETSHYEKLGRSLQELVSEAVRAERENFPASAAKKSQEEYPPEDSSIPLQECLIVDGLCIDSGAPVGEFLDPPRHMVPHPINSYAMKVTGDGMKEFKIEEDDILIVDCVLKPQHNNIVVTSVNDEPSIQRIKKKGEKVILMPNNHHPKPIEITEQNKLDIEGVVTWMIRQTV